MSNASPSRLVNGDKSSINVSAGSVIGVVGLDYRDLLTEVGTTSGDRVGRDLRSGGIVSTSDYREVVLTSVACTGTPGAVASATVAARAAYNMVAAMNEHLSSSSTTNSARTSAVQNHDYHQSAGSDTGKAPAAGILSFPCDFDHMYASMTDGGSTPAAATATSALGVSPLRGNEARHNDLTEVKHLKELLLLHLDLIQQQSEQIVTKDKLLAALRQENETVGERVLPHSRMVSSHIIFRVGREN